MITKIVGIVLVVFASVFVYAQLNCADCAHNQFGEPYCLARTNCKCFQIITVNGQKSCFTLDPCVLNQCLLAPQAYTLTSDKKLMNDIAAHPWITDTTSAEAIRVHSNAMGAVFETVQYIIKEKHKTDVSGWMSTNKKDPSDASGWVRYDLLQRAMGWMRYDLHTRSRLCKRSC